MICFSFPTSSAEQFPAPNKFWKNASFSSCTSFLSFILLAGKRENNNVNIRILSTYYSWQVSFIKVVIAQRRRNAFFVFFYFKKERKTFEIILDLFQKWLRSKLTILAIMIRIDVLVTFIKLDCLGYFNHLLAILATSISKLTILATFIKIGYFGYLNQNWLFWLL